MMVFNSLTSYRVVRHLTLISIIVLIITSVYYLNLTLEFMKKLIEHIEDADRAFARHAIQNITISKILIAPLQRSANDMYQKHEAATIVNIVTFASLIAISIAGIVVTLKREAMLLVIYGISLDIVYSTSFLYVSRVKPWICAFIVFVSILSFIHGRQIAIQKSTHKVSILQATSDNELIKDQNYKYEHTSEVV
ncbi:hypothetical protein BLOT_014398 [Blomia tropicalis]|nr:hypothetical protein BLOT_014398 [Blomia tropicalis]